MNDPDIHVKMRAMMTGRLLKIPGTNDVVKKILAGDSTAGVQLVGRQVLEPPVVNSFFGRSYPNFSKEEKVLIEKGADIYTSLCAACHGPSGAGTPYGEGKLMAPSLVGSARVQSHPDYVVKVLLHGLTGDIQGAAYAGGVMASMGKNSDEWIAGVASFIRTNFENESSLVTPQDVKRVRDETATQKQPYTFEAAWASIPHVVAFDESWKATASHTGEVRKGSTASPKGAFTFEGWTTGVTQKEGMWFQVELPRTIRLSEIQFRSPPISRGWRPGSPPPIPTYPRGYHVDISTDGKTWNRILANAEGERDNTVIRISPQEAKYVRLTLTKSEEIVHGERRGRPFDYEVTWNMRELKLFEKR
jgi:mono/diheme cytochrome c family protein